MKIVLLWLLVTVNEGSNADYKVIDRFPDLAACEHVQRNLPKPYGFTPGTRCIQARVVR